MTALRKRLGDWFRASTGQAIECPRCKQLVPVGELLVDKVKDYEPKYIGDERGEKYIETETRYHHAACGKTWSSYRRVARYVQGMFS